MKYDYKLDELIERYPVLSDNKDEIEKAVDLLEDCFKNGSKLLLCGNGGSEADCDHITGELLKGFLSKRNIFTKDDECLDLIKSDGLLITEEELLSIEGGLPAISLCSLTALNTAFSNDVNPDLIYAQGLNALSKPGDVLICISTSGNSKNVVKAASLAKVIGVNVISLTGKSGGKLKEISDIIINVPETETFKVQELHLPVYHYICAEIEKRMFG